MKSAHFHDHQQEEDNQFLVDSSCYGLSCYQNHNLNVTRDNTNSRDVDEQQIYHNINQVPISQDLGLHSISIENFKAYELQHLERMKHKLSITGSCSENRDIMSCNPTSSTTEEFISNNNIQRVRYDNDNNQDMMLKTYSEGCRIKSDQLMNQIHSSEESMFHSFDTNSCYTGTFSQIFPTLNVSNLNQPSSSFDINLPALDSFGSTTFNGSSSYQPSAYNAHNLGSLFKDNCFSYGVDQINRKIPPAFIFETTEAKRPAIDYRDAKVSEASPTKKSKLELRPSCTPLKVRKEKLGDRISALQQMVAPFGKTDTASVLTEAIGYIKFLQGQVEGSIKDGNEDIKRDLRSRGLCLVPISCLTYVSYTGGNVWATL
ncbi:putative transcription factor bHLH family [Helianthus debilis subsp. tardiflorus]